MLAWLLPTLVLEQPGLQALELAAASPDWQELRLPVAVAFNPYFPDAGRQQEERRRLRRKLMAGRGRVAAVYLQVGVWCM